MKKNEMMKRVFSFLLAMVMLLSAVPMGAISARAMDPQVRVADEATHTSWKQFFNLEELSTENAGMVWTDKSVFTEVPDDLKGLRELDSNSTTDITMDPAKKDNFLVTLSAMASNKTITGYSTIPTDTMLVLDVSGSMKNNGCYDDMVGAANAAIQRLQDINNNNRVGVVLYSGNSSTGDSDTSTATVLLPLGRYTTTEVKNNQKVYLNYSTGETPTVSINDKVRIEGTVNRPTAQTKKVVGGTYIQNGLYKAMNALLAANPVVEDGKIQAGTTRMPILVLMSDGAPTAATARYMEPQTSHMGNGSGSYTNNAIGFVTQLTAAYAKAKVAQHYGREAMFYTLGLGMNDMSDTEKTVAAHVLNPGQYMHDTATDAYDRYWSSYNALSGSQTMEIEWQQPIGNNRTQKETSRIAKADIAIKQDYVNDFFKAESSQGVSMGQALINAFEKIVDEIILQSRYSPTLVSSGLHDLDGYVSFVDHIGEHMEVTDIKGMVIGDHYYSGAAFCKYIVTGEGGTMENPSELGDEFIRSIKKRLGITDTGTAQALIQQAYNHGQIAFKDHDDYSNYVGWYSDDAGKFVGFWYEGIDTAVPAGATHINKSYGFLGEADPDHGVQQTDMMYTTVRVRKEIATGDETLAWAIPASLIPTITYEVKLNGETYDSTLESISATGAEAPIRLIYEVELDEEIHDYNIHEIVQGVGGHKDHYNEETGEYTFYSNDWDAQNVESNVNTYAYFEASKENEYYYYISDTVVYDEDGKAVPASTDFEDDQYYYHEYYVYTKNGTRKDLIRIAPSALEDAKKDGDNWVIPKGTAYQLLTNRTRTKNNNEPNSGTLEYIVWPVVDKTPDVQYHTAAVLGNNGKLVVKPTTGIKVTKAVTETVEGASNTFTFIISGGTGNAKLVRPGANDDGTDVTVPLTFTEGKAEFTIDAGKTVYITGLQANTEYTITEKGNPDYAVETVTVGGQEQDAAVITLEAGQMQTVDFVNAPRGYGNLNITKEITSAENYTVPENILNKEFNLTVTMAGLANQTFQVKHSRLVSLETVTTDSEGKFTVALMNRDTFQVLDIPENTVVTVAEPAPGENFTVTYRSRNQTGENADEDGQVTIGKDVNSTVVVMNRYAPKSTTVDLDIKGTKIFNPESPIAAEFTFKVQHYSVEEGKWVDLEGKTATVEYSNNEKGQKDVVINDILKDVEFTKPGEYAFQVMEVIPTDKVDGITYDRSLHTFTVSITDVGGQLTASVTTHHGALDAVNDTFTVVPEFVNTYHTAPVYLDVFKAVDNKSGSPLAVMNGFKFNLYKAKIGANGWEIDGAEPFMTQFSDGVGEARFAWTVDGKVVGPQYYILKESDSGVAGWDYDEREYHVTVNVVKNGENGDVTATSTVTDENGNAVKKIEFANIYTPTSTTLNLAAKKALTGRNLTAEDEGKFQFAIFKDGETSNPVATGTNGANGNITFINTSNPESGYALSFDQVGTFSYDVREVISAEDQVGGVTYDATIYDLVVEVTDNGGRLQAEAFYEDATGTVVTFTNRYNAAPTTLTLGGNKTLKNRDLLATEFSFQLKDAAGEVLQTVHNGGAVAVDGKAVGAFKFAPITYTKPGTYTYTISEVQRNLTGVTNDQTVYMLTVEVIDNGVGQLVAKIDGQAVTEKNGYDFTNTFTPREIKHTLSGTKNLTGKELVADAYTFVLTDKDGNFIESANNKADKSFTFSEMTFNRTGTYEYKVYEMPGFEDGMTYDKTVYDVKIVVTYNQNEGVFNKEVTISGNGDLVFNNAYVAPAHVTIAGNKTLTNPKGESVNFNAGDFSFVLANAANETMETVSNDASGNFTFSQLTFWHAGDYEYHITEQKGEDSSIIYDDTLYHVHVHVEPNAEGTALVATSTIGIPSQEDTHVESLTFRNKTREPVQVHLEASKILEGVTLTGGEFNFTAEGHGKTLEATNDANGKVEFEALTFDKAGTYTYTITETAGSDAYVKYDTAAITATVVVTAPENNGPFQATVTYSKTPVFTNKPSNAPGSFSFMKVDEQGHPLAGATFSLHHVNCGNCQQQIGPFHPTSYENGVVTFSEIPTGHQYLLKEDSAPSGYKQTYDRPVTDIYGKFYIEGELTEANNLFKIANVKADATEVLLKGRKILVNTQDQNVVPENNTYTFELLNANKEVIETQRNIATAEGGQAYSEFFFKSIPLTAIGEYSYYIREVQDSANTDVIYDTTLYKVVVKVVQENDSLKVESVNYYSGTNFDNCGNAVSGVSFTNQLRKDAEVTLKAAKRLEGKTLEAGAYTFYLKNEAGEVIQTKTNAANGDIVFDALTYGDVGTYHYTIEEQNGGDPYTTYDSRIIHVTVTVAVGEGDHADAYVADVVYMDAAGSVIKPEFHNIFSDRGEASLNLMKIDELNEPLEGVEFTLTHNCGETCTVSIDPIKATSRYTGVVLLEHIPSGHTYTLSETKVPENYTKVADRTVRVSFGKVYIDGSDQPLTSALTIVNYFQGKAAIQGVKNLEGRALKEGEFEFNLYKQVTTADGEVNYELVQTVANAANGTFVFDAIEYGAEGTYKYVVEEAQGDLPGIAYDDTLYEVTVNVESVDGELVPTITYKEVAPAATLSLRGNNGDVVFSDVLEFTNVFTPEPSKVPLSGTKTLNGKDLKKDEFSFQLMDEEGKVLQTVKNDADGNFTFKELEFKTAGTYKYTVSEVKGDLENVVYDTTVYNVTVVVTQDAVTGALSYEVTIDKDGELAFTNTYDPNAIPVVIEGRKNLTGRDMQEGEFEFILKQENNPFSVITRNDVDGKFDFSLSFSETGDYKYTLYEKAGSAPGVEYDDTVYYFIVHVTADPTTGELKSEIIYTDAEYNEVKDISEIVFANTYDPDATNLVVEATKELTGRDIKEGEFEFVLIQEGNPLSVLTVNDAEGNIDFNLVFNEAGEYHYTLSERAGSDPNMTYDDTEYYFTVVVTDTGNGTLETQIVYTDETREAEKHVEEMVFRNTFTPNPVTVKLEGSKELIGRRLADKEFSFQLADEDNKTLQTVWNNADGFAFGELEFKTAGTYKYTVSEVKGDLENVVYDTTVYNVTVEVTKDATTGVLSSKVTVDKGGELAFTNTYEPDAIPVVIEGRKNLTGRDMQEGEFEFILKPEDKALSVATRNHADGSFDFHLSFSETGEYKYHLYEKQGSAPGVAYDDTDYYFIVKVTADPATGNLQSEIIFTDAEYNAEKHVPEIVFENTYDPDATNLVVEATKELTGRDMKAGEFEFVLTREDSPLSAMTTNDEDGKIDFNLIFHEAGEYYYTLSERAGSDPNMTYDDTEYYFTVVVTDSGNGTLDTQIVFTDETRTAEIHVEKMLFQNTYTPDPAVVALKGIKTLTGKNLEKDEFSFQLMDEEGNVLQTVKNGADGKFAFEELKFETTGTYKYTVSEIDENQEGMVYDTTVYNVTVVVTKDAATGVLSAEVTIDNGGKLTFTNTYDPDAVPVVIKGKKVLIGRPMIAGEFKFILTQNGNPVPAVAWNDAFGNFGFNLVFSEPGEYHYTVRELNGGATGMTYDNAVYYFTVIVTDSGDGKLKSEIIFTDASRTHVVNVNKMVFRNSYKPNPTSVKLEGTKTLVGRTLKQGEFTFQLKDQAGNVLQTVKNAADGTISFADLEYRGVGVYTYTVTEVKGDDETITYDETVYTATVVVTDYNGNLRAVVTIDNGGELAFTNTYEPEPTEPEPTEPEPTEPEPTEPEPTEPEPTEPEPTEPEPTEPEPTEPEPTEPEPTEPEPTEPEPTEPEPTEPEPTEPEPTKPEPTEPETTKPGYDDVPSTRDNNKVLLWAMLAGFAMIGMLAVNPFKKKGRYCR